MIRTTLAIAALLAFTTRTTMAQEADRRSYDLKFLAAKYIDTTTTPEILLVFKYVPHSGKEFKPIFSMKMGYQFEGDEMMKTQLINKAGQAITFYGEDLKEKSSFIYDVISQKIRNDMDARFGFVVFELRNLRNSYTPKMQFKYGLWEPENTELRFEELYDISIDR